MITCKLLLCAQGVVRDAENGGISIYNILEGVQAAGFPFFLQQVDIFAVFTRLAEDPAQYDIVFRVALGDTELVATHLAVDFEDKLRNRSILHVQGLVLPHPGVVKLTAEHGENILGTYEIRVEQIAPPRVETRQEPAGMNATVGSSPVPAAVEPTHQSS